MQIPDIKLIAMDLDGTLLKNDKTIDEHTFDRLMKAQEKGIIIVIATGRNKGGISFVYEPLKLETQGNHYVAGINGQIVYSFKNKEYTVDRVLSGQDAKKVMKVAQRMNFECISCCGYDHYDLISRRLKFFKNLRSRIHGKPMDYGLAQGQRKFMEIHTPDYEIHQDINKIILIQTTRYFDRNIAKIREALSDYDVLRVGGAWVELMPKGVSKGSAILKIADMNGIKKEEILCFGDAENDLSMFEMIPHAIAMGNAMDIVKEKAFAVTDTNEKSGIGKALDTYIFQKD